jgi:hypothetical protein
VLGFAGSGDSRSQNWELLGPGHRSGGMYLSSKAALRILILGSVVYGPRDRGSTVYRLPERGRRPMYPALAPACQVAVCKVILRL